jgi:hypothetical protein
MADPERRSICSRASCARASLRLRHHMQWVRQELEWWATTRRTICGITVGLLPWDRLATPEAQELAFKKVAMGFDLISAYEPRRLSASRRLLRCILIRAQHGPGYRPTSNLWVLSADSVLDRSHGVLAGQVIHETMHARFAEAGLVSFLLPRSVQRMEEGCVREEIAFARCVPKEIYVNRTGYIEFLEAELKKQWWTPEEQARRYKEWREHRIR